MRRERMTAGSGAELARRIEELCSIGISSRAAGECLGVRERAQLRRMGSGGASASTVPASAMLGPAARRRYAAHCRSGHDASCLAIGIPQVTIERALADWDGNGAGRLIAEAVAEAVREINALGPGWDPGAAQESVAFAIRRRITPSGVNAPRGGSDAQTLPSDDSDRFGRARLRCRDRPRTLRPRAAASPA